MLHRGQRADFPDGYRHAQDVKEYCRKLIETCGKGGGYILAGGAQVDNGKLENVRAMLAAKEYGVYKK